MQCGCWPMATDKAPRVHELGWLLKACVGSRYLWFFLDSDSDGIEVLIGHEESVQTEMIVSIPDVNIIFFKVNWFLINRVTIADPSAHVSSNRVTKRLVNRCQRNQISDWSQIACWKIPLLQPKVKHLFRQPLHCPPYPHLTELARSKP